MLVGVSGVGIGAGRREEIGDGAHEFRCLDRLVEMRAAKGGDGAQSLRGDVSSQNNSWNGPLEFFPKLGDDFDAIWAVRKVEVGDDNVGNFRRSNRNDAIGGPDRTMAASAQQHFEKFANGRIILDDKN